MSLILFTDPCSLLTYIVFGSGPCVPPPVCGLGGSGGSGAGGVGGINGLSNGCKSERFLPGEIAGPGGIAGVVGAGASGAGAGGGSRDGAGKFFKLITCEEGGGGAAEGVGSTG